MGATADPGPLICVKRWMDRRDRLESRLALAMLPVGAALTLAAVIGFLAAMLLALDTVMRHPAATVWLLAWCIAAGIVAVFNAIKAIETMSSFTWTPLMPVAIASLAIVAAYPGWWIG